eukprot:gene7628-8430_t
MEGKRSFNELYCLNHRLGSGMSAEVFHCTQLATGKEFAVKVIDLKKMALAHAVSVSPSQDILREAQLMRQLDHINIVSLEDAFCTTEHAYMVLELLSGGDLLDRIIKRERYEEQFARQVVRQLVSALAYLHSLEIVHRDIKPENILLVSEDDDITVKLTDFGLAKRPHAFWGLKTFCGTPQYFAPEVWKSYLAGPSNASGYNKAVDIWSLGVVSFVLLSGSLPFQEDHLISQLERSEFDCGGPEWTNVSPIAVDFIRSLLVADPAIRPPIEQVANHPWLCDVSPAVFLSPPRTMAQTDQCQKPPLLPYQCMLSQGQNRKGLKRSRKPPLRAPVTSLARALTASPT